MAATYAQAAYVANAEKAGIPTVELGFMDQEPQFHQVGLTFGEPNCRWISVPRVGQGPERVAQFGDAMIKCLTDPLTAKEKESGMYNPPPDPRICFSGNDLDAQTFFQKTSIISVCKNCPLAQWTDGLPVIIPTEENVKKMLTGTSHKGEEYLAYGKDQTISFSSSGIRVDVKKGDPVYFLPMAWGTNVEKVAINCVMAGCKPSALPILLASLETGSAFVTTNCPAAYYLSVSGPIVKEVGLNVKDPYQVGVPSNMAIGRAYDLCFYNIGGATQGSANTNLGNPTNRTGACIGEDTDGLPTGWEPDQTLASYAKPDGTRATATQSQSVVRVFANVFSSGGWITSNFSPQAFTDLNQGKGPIARYMGVEGKPGKYNVLEFVIPQLIGAQAAQSGAAGWVMSPDIAKSLYDYGFKTKASINTWLNDNITITAKDYKGYGWWDFNTGGGTRTIAGSTGPDGKPYTYANAPDDFIIHPMTSAYIIVSNSVGGGSIEFFGNANTAHLIDPWR